MTGLTGKQGRTVAATLLANDPTMAGAARRLEKFSPLFFSLPFS